MSHRVEVPSVRENLPTGRFMIRRQFHPNISRRDWRGSRIRRVRTLWALKGQPLFLGLARRSAGWRPPNNEVWR